MRIELVWPDGTITTGDSWTEVEEAIRASQWRTYKTRREFRREMRRRAENWSGRTVKPGPPWTSEAFIKQLADAEMFMVNVEGA